MQTNDFASLLQLLDLSQQSGILIVSRQGEIWQASLQLQDGKWLACSLLNRRNAQILLEGEQAIYWLSQQGALNWQLATPQQSRAPAAASVSVRRRSRLIPRRLAPVLNRMYSREARHIFLLIDGKRSLEDMARLLHKPYEEVVKVAQVLVAEGVLTISRD